MAIFGGVEISFLNEKISGWLLRRLGGRREVRVGEER